MAEGEKRTRRRPGRRPSRDYKVLEEHISPVAYYKLLLNTFLDRRPPGSRQALADAIGKDRSFISQVANPGYPVALPARYVRAICSVSRFTAAEEQVFLRAYLAAHPDRAADIYGLQQRAGGVHRLAIAVPALENNEQQQKMELFLQGFTRDLADLLSSGQEAGAGTSKAPS